ncbi:DoxX family protein [Streptomyces sp. 2A115]|uniref:DoxX family protein n=1 Tax=Streptomyces sp. 2A115 TaxID=3457439 RepID=UPI003FCF757B
MFAAYVAVNLLTATALGYGAYLDLVGHESIATIADRLSVPRSWMVPLGTLLGAGAVGLLIGFVVPLIGTAAAACLVLYFLGAIGAHLRVGDRRLGSAAAFLSLSVAVLALGLAHRGAW